MSGPSLRRQHLNPEGLPDWSDMFSQVVTVEAAGLKTIFVSGQVAATATGDAISQPGLQEQTEASLRNLGLALASANATCKDVTRLTIFVVDYEYSKAAVIKGVMARYFDPGRMPALSLIGVSALAKPEFEIEVEAVAHIDTVKV